MSTPYFSTYTGAQVDDAVGKAFASHTALRNLYEGSLVLGSAVSGGSVSGLNLPFTPTKAFLQVEVPSGGLVIFPVVVKDTLTADGFAFYLSGETDAATYVLHYLIVGSIDVSESSS